MNKEEIIEQAKYESGKAFVLKKGVRDMLEAGDTLCVAAEMKVMK